MSIKKEVKSRKLKVGSKVCIIIQCEITGGDIQVFIPVVQENDTDVLLRWKADNWYKKLSDVERENIAAMIA